MFSCDSIIIIIIFAAYSTNNLYQTSSNSNHTTVSAVKNKRTPRAVRPPSCARPTISSLRKMNRTFSLNNVSNVGVNNTDNGVGVVAAAAGGLPANTHQIQTTSQALNGQNIVLPLTQASLAMANAAASSSSFSNGFMSANSRNFNANAHQANMNADDSMIRMTLMNNANKFSAKYASSTYLNDYGSPSRPMSQQHMHALPQPQQPHQTRTTPRRRTPRNAEEFLKASGVVDTQTFLNKGYYVGSMFNLNEISKNSSVMASNTNLAGSHQTNSAHHHQNQTNMLHHTENQTNLMHHRDHQTNSSHHHQNQTNLLHHRQVDHMHNPSSSSSSSTTGFKLHHTDFKSPETHQLMSSKVQRRNSIHDTTSVSLANLNFLNINSHSINEHSPNSLNNNNNMNNLDGMSVNSKSSYYRNSSAYNKNRSATTAILPSNLMQNADDRDLSTQSDQRDESSNGSSAPGSNSSSSPVPLKQHYQQSQQPHLGPLMSAVSKLESESANLSSSSPSSHKNEMLHRFENDLYDDDEYEYLERNLGAEPFNSPPLIMNQQAATKSNLETNTTATTTTTTTTNTNVTDYYTDESYSFGNNDDGFKQQQQQQKYLNNDVNTNPSTTTATTLLNSAANKQMQHQQQQLLHSHNHMHQNSPHVPTNGLNTLNGNNMLAPTTWDHTSLASSNSLFSGL